MTPRIVRVGLLTVVLALLSVVWAPGASAHAFLTSSNPGDGATVTAAPRELRLDFSESVVLGATSITTTDTAGHAYRATHLHLVRGDDTEEPSYVVASLPPLDRGAYRVAWKTISSDDFHQTSGVFAFGVGTAVRPSPFVEPLPRPEEAALRWLVFLGLAAALGGLLLCRLGRGRAGFEIARGRRFAAAGAGLASAAAVGLLVDQLAGDATVVGGLLVGRYGLLWGVRETGLLLLLWGALRAHGAVRTAVTSLGTACVAVGSALLGHSGAEPDLAITRVVADAAHLTAAAVWTGLLLAAALLLVRRARPATIRDVLRGFRYPAAASVSVLLITGLYLSSDVAGSVDAVLLTFYGRVLLLKVGLGAAAGLIGLSSWLRLHRRPRTSVPRRAVRAEAALLVLATAGAALLTSAQPAREPQFVRDSAPPVVAATDAGVADLQETLAVRPNLPGRNLVLVDVFDTRRPAPAPISAVTVAVDGGPAVAAQQLGGGGWSVPVVIGSSGSRRLHVSVVRVGMPVAAHDYRWTVRGGPLARRATVSNAPIAGPLRVAAGSLAAGIALAVSVSIASARRRRRGPDAPAPATAETPDNVLVDA